MLLLFPGVQDPCKSVPLHSIQRRLSCRHAAIHHALHQRTPAFAQQAHWTRKTCVRLIWPTVCWPQVPSADTFAAAGCRCTVQHNSIEDVAHPGMPCHRRTLGGLCTACDGGVAGRIRSQWLLAMACRVRRGSATKHWPVVGIVSGWHAERDGCAEGL
jgi:hypothetical protein